MEMVLSQTVLINFLTNEPRSVQCIAKDTVELAPRRLINTHKYLQQKRFNPQKRRLYLYICTGMNSALVRENLFVIFLNLLNIITTRTLR
jgi:hypothetical protein